MNGPGAAGAELRHNAWTPGDVTCSITAVDPAARFIWARRVPRGAVALSERGEGLGYHFLLFPVVEKGSHRKKAARESAFHTHTANGPGGKRPYTGRDKFVGGLGRAGAVGWKGISLWTSCSGWKNDGEILPEILGLIIHILLL